MDDETKAVINVVKAANAKNYDLAEFIPTLEMDWIDIEWDNSLRRVKPEPAPKPQYGSART